MGALTHYQVFIGRILQRPLPTGAMACIRIFAHELAEGAAEELWETELIYDSRMNDDALGTWTRLDTFKSDNLKNYLSHRWDNKYPDLKLLVQNGFLDFISGDYLITSAAFHLIDEVEPAEIFISYRRKDSSAFALLVLFRLKEFELNAFLDMSLQPGDNWHAYIKEQIQQRDYFIMLIGKETLKSEVVKQEILWAIEAKAEIIPIWHNGFEYKDGEFDLSPEIQKVLHSNHSIRVLEESALAYNNAIVELLNRFGVTP